MREIGIVTLLSVAVTAAAPGPQAYRPSVYVTPKSTQDFASCFARVEDRRGGRREIALDQRAADAAPRKALNECI